MKKSEMRKEIESYMSGKPNYDVRQTLHVFKIGRDYIHMISLCEGSRPFKVTIDNFYNDYVADVAAK